MTEALPNQATPSGSTEQPTARLARAVVYLRVSTKEQAERGGSAEGFSIPAQREACLRKAAALNAEVIDEFIDAGESAKTAHRPELQRLLTFLQDGAIQFVIVHKVDRLARNRVDDVEINVAIRKAGAALVSCTENIDDTPSGALMHGIMSSIAEFYSRNLANEVIKGSTQKAKGGGTVGKAPTGYLNIRKWENGREIRTVAIDPDRGPLMRWVFEEYATGEWSIRRLLDAATARGLSSKGGPNTPSKPLSVSNFCRLLGTPYYYGLISYRGVDYEGTHEPLISKELFMKVQEVLAAHAASGEKRRTHHHYLLGSVVCAQCGSRLGVMNAKNRYGTVYPYFYCLGRQEKRTLCMQRVLRIEVVEELVAAEWVSQELSMAERQGLEGFIRTELHSIDEENRQERRRQRMRIEVLKSERQKLLQAHYADAVPFGLFKSEQQRISVDLESSEMLLARSSAEMDKVAIAIGQALDLMISSGEAYRSATPKDRRKMNQSLFEVIRVGDSLEFGPEHTERYRLLLDPSIRSMATQAAAEAEIGTAMEVSSSTRASCRRKRPPKPGENARTSSFAGRGSRIDWLVGEGGLEPPHPCEYWHLKPARLPIPPLARVEPHNRSNFANRTQHRFGQRGATDCANKKPTGRCWADRLRMWTPWGGCEHESSTGRTGSKPRRRAPSARIGSWAQATTVSTQHGIAVVRARCRAYGRGCVFAFE